MINLLDEANQRLTNHNQQFQIILGSSSDSSLIRCGRDRIFCDQRIKAEFQLIEIEVEGRPVIIRDSNWSDFLSKIETEFGSRFMRQTKLINLKTEKPD